MQTTETYSKGELIPYDSYAYRLLKDKTEYYNFVYPVFSEKRPFVEIIKQERPIQAMIPFSITIYDDSFFTIG